MRTPCRLQAVLVAALLGVPLAGGALAADRVKTTSGVVEGTGRQASGVRMFKGIPFAAPPVGELRWKAPQPLKTWQGVRPATQFGPRCMQQPVFGDMNFRSNGMSEDCLYLNVWTPARSGADRLPVLVYFYGGGFRAGDGSEPRYDGESMARRGIVALTVNYRLGRVRLLRAPGAHRGVAEPRVRQSGIPGSGRRVAVGEAQHRGIRRRSVAGHDRRRVGRLNLSQRADGVACGENPLRQGDW